MRKKLTDTTPDGDGDVDDDVDDDVGGDDDEPASHDHQEPQ